MANVIGIDIGGTKILASALNQADLSDTQTLCDTLAKTPPMRMATPQSAAGFVTAITELVASISDVPVQAVGISTAGIVDSVEGKILGSTANLPFLMTIANLKEKLEKALGNTIPVVLENDANAAALAEASLGAGQGCNPLLMVTLGTGVGGGFVVDGKIYHGHGFSAMEIGHICINRTTERHCTCGRLGCWEAYASGRGLEKTIRATLRDQSTSRRTTLRELGKPVEALTTHDLMDAVAEGDAVASAILDCWHQDIATGLGSVINVLSPQRVVVGGGLSACVDFDRLQGPTFRQAMLHVSELAPAQLGNHAGMIGAALLAQAAL